MTAKTVEQLSELSPAQRRRALRYLRQDQPHQAHNERKRANELIAAIMTDEERAAFVVSAGELITQARVANRKGPKFLKAAADATRRFLYLCPPEEIIDAAWGQLRETDAQKWRYKDSLTLGEIEQMLLVTIQQRGLSAWYEQVKDDHEQRTNQ
jgi:hypothetical protein